MARHEHDDDHAPDHARRYPNYPDTRRIDRDLPRGLFILVFCTVVVVAGMFFGSIVFLSSRGVDVQPIIDAVTGVEGIVPGILSTLVLIVLGVVKRQTNRVEALAGREGPSFVMDELAALREAVARVEAAPVLTSGPIPVTVAATPEPDLYGVTVEADPQPQERSPYAVPDDGAIVVDPRSWQARTGDIPRVREYRLDPDDEVVAYPPPTRPGRREAVPAWSDVPHLQETPVPNVPETAPSRWAKPGG